MFRNCPRLVLNIGEGRGLEVVENGGRNVKFIILLSKKKNGIGLYLRSFFLLETSLMLQAAHILFALFSSVFLKTVYCEWPCPHSF